MKKNHQRSRSKLLYLKWKKWSLSCDSTNYGSSTHQHGTPHSLPTDGLADDIFSASKAASQSAQKCQNMLFWNSAERCAIWSCRLPQTGVHINMRIELYFTIFVRATSRENTHTQPNILPNNYGNNVKTRPFVVGLISRTWNFNVELFVGKLHDMRSCNGTCPNESRHSRILWFTHYHSPPHLENLNAHFSNYWC